MSALALSEIEIDAALHVALGRELAAVPCFVIEVLAGDAWIACETDGRLATFPSRDDAESEARFSLDDNVTWRVVEHAESVS